MSKTKPGTKKVRIDDTMLEITAHPAVINYQDVRDACEVVPDDDYRPPWKECDGWEHRFVPDYKLPLEIADAKKLRGYVYTQDHESGVIFLEDELKEQLYSGSDLGLSKQARAERRAESVREALDQLVRWYKRGWSAYGVTCDYLGYGDSLWGIQLDDDADPDDDHYIEEVKNDCASHVVDQLEEAGYTVIGQPEPWDEKKTQRRALRNEIARKALTMLVGRVPRNVPWHKSYEVWKKDLLERRRQDDEEEHQFLNKYECPSCRHRWSEVWTATCDSECPKCGMRNISPTESEDVEYG